ncbi:MAG: hypothetical protein K0B08_03925 [Bacteroidales bacterium]|nr:hypothetical protein [Bacteroidales bacterium]
MKSHRYHPYRLTRRDFMTIMGLTTAGVTHSMKNLVGIVPLQYYQLPGITGRRGVRQPPVAGQTERDGNQPLK